MKILIVSDVHNQWDKLSTAIAHGVTEGCEVLLFAGDAHTPHIYSELCAFPGEIHAISGNNDKPHALFIPMLLMHPRVQHHGEVMDRVFDGVRMHMNHYPEVAEHAALSGSYTLCIHGHTHRQRNELAGTTQILNPGEVCGSRYGTASCALYDTTHKTITFFTIPS
jgi:putative phosphoesterase